MQGVQLFLGFCNFYWQFIKGYSQIVKLLNHLMKKGSPFVLTGVCKQVFKNLKKKLTEALILRHYNSTLRTWLKTDASDRVVASMPLQWHEDVKFWLPIAFYSKMMVPAEQNYKIQNKELLAIIQCLKEWQAELAGLWTEGPFDILTNHWVLKYFMMKWTLNAWQAHWSEFISKFNFLIQYWPGKLNDLADILSQKDGKLPPNPS